MKSTHRVLLIVVILAVVVGGVVLGLRSRSQPAAGGKAAQFTHSGLRRTAVSMNGSGKHVEIGRVRMHLLWHHGIGPLTASELQTLHARIADNDVTAPLTNVLHVSHTNVPAFLSSSLRLPSTKGTLTDRGTLAESSGDVAEANDIIPPNPTAHEADSVKEPSVAMDGSNIMVAGNWFADYSSDGGRSWQQIDVNSRFGTGFCCDQVVIYDPAVNLFFWLLQFEPPKGQDGGNELKLAIDSPADGFANPCVYSWNAGLYGLDSKDFIDYNDMEFSDHDLYINSNVYPPNDAARHGAVTRWPLSDLANCVDSPNVTSFEDPDASSLRPVQGAHGVMYWGTNYVYDHKGGTAFRIYGWPEGSDTYTTYDRTVDPFNVETPNLGRPGDGHCGSQNGVVTNWCQRTSGETTSGVLDGSTLTFAVDVAPLGAQRPWPYARLLSFDTGTLKYLGSTDLYNAHVAIQYTAMAVNSHGDLGGIFAWGGGDGNNAYYPGVGVFLAESGGQGGVAFALDGGGNSCVYSGDHNLRWGDYLTVRPRYPGGTTFEAAGFDLSGGNCGRGGTVDTHLFTFGRSADLNSLSG